MDRRSLRVLLTSKGLKVVDKAIASRFDEARDALRALSAKEQKLLQDLLRRILLALDPSGPRGA
jgi:DNA-binding MarR family transcriptional regulator